MGAARECESTSERRPLPRRHESVPPRTYMYSDQLAMQLACPGSFLYLIPR